MDDDRFSISSTTILVEDAASRPNTEIVAFFHAQSYPRLTETWRYEPGVIYGGPLGPPPGGWAAWEKERFEKGEYDLL